MDTTELKREQRKLAERIVLRDDFTNPKTVGGVDCVQRDNKLIACVAVCEYPSMKLLEKQTFVLPDPLPFRPGFLAYREMPAMIEAFNKLENEPDILLVDGDGILHHRKLGIASHIGLALNKSTIGVTRKLSLGRNENNKIYLDKDLVGFEIKTREYANPLYVSPGNLVTLGNCLKVVQDSIKPPHKLPEPIHLAHKLAKKKMRNLENE